MRVYLPVERANLPGPVKDAVSSLATTAENVGYAIDDACRRWDDIYGVERPSPQEDMDAALRGLLELLEEAVWPKEEQDAGAEQEEG